MQGVQAGSLIGELRSDMPYHMWLKTLRGEKKEISYNFDSLCVKNWSPILTLQSEAVVILSKGLEPGTLFYSIPLIN